MKKLLLFVSDSLMRDGEIFVYDQKSLNKSVNVRIYSKLYVYFKFIQTINHPYVVLSNTYKNISNECPCKSSYEVNNCILPMSMVLFCNLFSVAKGFLTHFWNIMTKFNHDKNLIISHRMKSINFYRQ